MSDRSRLEKAWGEAVSAAWRSGGNPDAVDRDIVADDVRSGFGPAECGDREASRQHRHRVAQARERWEEEEARREQEEEEEWEEQEK